MKRNLKTWIIRFIALSTSGPKARNENGTFGCGMVDHEPFKDSEHLWLLANQQNNKLGSCLIQKELSIILQSPL